MPLPFCSGSWSRFDEAMRVLWRDRAQSLSEAVEQSWTRLTTPHPHCWDGFHASSPSPWPRELPSLLPSWERSSKGRTAAWAILKGSEIWPAIQRSVCPSGTGSQGPVCLPGLRMPWIQLSTEEPGTNETPKCPQGCRRNGQWPRFLCRNMEQGPGQERL